jgi:hypothetical protein
VNKKFTGFKDKNNKDINYHDILMNSSMNDLWIVHYDNIKNIFVVGLISSSGIIKHSDNAKYPYHVEDLDVVNETFEVIGNIDDTN